MKSDVRRAATDAGVGGDRMSWRRTLLDHACCTPRWCSAMESAPPPTSDSYREWVDHILSVVQPSVTQRALAWFVNRYRRDNGPMAKFPTEFWQVLHDLPDDVVSGPARWDTEQ